MAIASDIRPGDDPVEVSEKLVGRTRTKLLNELFGYFDIPDAMFNHIFENLYSRDTLTQRELQLSLDAEIYVVVNLSLTHKGDFSIVLPRKSKSCHYHSLPCLD